jgi:hypothetical protein
MPAARIISVDEAWTGSARDPATGPESDETRDVQPLRPSKRKRLSTIASGFSSAIQ